MEEFQGGGGSKWGLVLKIGGIGCAVVILIGVVLGGMGVFKAVSCCSEFSELTEVGRQSSEWSYDFALALHQGDFEEAESFVVTGEEARFREEAQAYGPLFQASMPYPIEYAPAESSDLQEMSERSRWQMQTAYYAPQEEEGLTLRFDVEARRIDETTLEFEVLSWTFERTARDLENNRWVEAVRRFNETLSAERYAELQHRTDRSNQDEGMSETQLKEHFASLRDVVLGTRLQVQSLQPVGPHLMEVVVDLEDIASREIRQVGYLITRQGLVHDFRIGPRRQGATRPALDDANAPEEAPSDSSDEAPIPSTEQGEEQEADRQQE